MIAALLSDENRWVYGQRIEVSGGLSLWPHDKPIPADKYKPWLEAEMPNIIHNTKKISLSHMDDLVSHRGEEFR